MELYGSTLKSISITVVFALLWNTCDALICVSVWDYCRVVIFIIVQWPCDNDMPTDPWLILSTEWYWLLSSLPPPHPLLGEEEEECQGCDVIHTNTHSFSHTHTPQSKAGEWKWECYLWHLQINRTELRVSNWERADFYFEFSWEITLRYIVVLKCQPYS